LTYGKFNITELIIVVSCSEKILCVISLDSFWQCRVLFKKLVSNNLFLRINLPCRSDLWWICHPLQSQGIYLRVGHCSIEVLGLVYGAPLWVLVQSRQHDEALDRGLLKNFGLVSLYKNENTLVWSQIRFMT
jgi:hypothetical protein